MREKADEPAVLQLEVGVQLEHEQGQPDQREPDGIEGDRAEHRAPEPVARLGHLLRERQQRHDPDRGKDAPVREEHDRAARAEQHLQGHVTTVGPVPVARDEQRVRQREPDRHRAKHRRITAADHDRDVRGVGEQQVQRARREQRVRPAAPADIEGGAEKEERRQEGKAPHDHVARQRREVRPDPPLQHGVHGSVVHVHEGDPAGVVDVDAGALGEHENPARALAQLDLDRHPRRRPHVPDRNREHPRCGEEGHQPRDPQRPAADGRVHVHRRRPS